jgi:hypothetical protein
MLSMTAFGLEWIKPSVHTYVGIEYPLALSLLQRERNPSPGQRDAPWGIERWRDYFRDMRLTATVSVDGFVVGTQPPVALERRTGYASPSSVVDFAGKIRGFSRPDRYSLRAEINSDSSANSWVQASDNPITVEAVPFPDLRVITLDSRGSGQPVRIRLTPEEANSEPTILSAGLDLKYQLELWQEVDGPSVVNPALRVRFRIGRQPIDLDAHQGALKQVEERPDRRKVVWRSGLIPLESAADDVRIVVEGGAGPLHGVLKVPPPPVVPVLTAHSGLMNPEGSNNCPPGNAAFFELQGIREIRLLRGEKPSLTKIATPFGHEPVCLVFRWPNHVHFQQFPWELKLTSSSAAFDRTLRSRDGTVTSEGAAQGWKSTAVEIPRAALSGLSSELKLGSVSYFAQYDEEQLAQGGPAMPFLCRKGGDCLALELGQKNKLTFTEDEPLWAFLQLRAPAAPAWMPSWRIPEAGEGMGRFRIDRVDPKDHSWILRTDEKRIPNTENKFSVFIDSGEYEVNLYRGFWWNLEQFIIHWFHKLAFIYYGWHVIVLLVGAVALLLSRFFSGRMPGKELGQVHHYPKHIRAELSVILSKLWIWLRNNTIPRDRFWLNLSWPGIEKACRIAIPEKWARKSYLVIDDGITRVAPRQFGRPRGACLRISIVDGHRLELSPESGKWTIAERGQGWQQYSLNGRTYGTELAALAGGLQLEVNGGPDPQHQQTIRLQYGGRVGKRAASLQPAPAMR